MSTKSARDIVTERTHDFHIEVEGRPYYWERRLTVKEGLRQLLIDHPHLEDAEIVLVPLKNFSRL